jgi:hypothetical protein
MTPICSLSGVRDPEMMGKASAVLRIEWAALMSERGPGFTEIR